MSQIARIYEQARQRIGALYGEIRAEPRRPRQPIEIPPDQVEPAAPRPPSPPPADGVDRVEPFKDYLSVVLNQLFLAEARQWFARIDPTVLATTEFLYDGKTRTEPVVVGPRKDEGLPAGTVIRNMPVFGPSPYRGGGFCFTFVLSQMQVGNVARALLEVVEATARAVPTGLPIADYTKIGGVVLDGFERLAGLAGVEPLLALRESINPDAGQVLRPGRFALIDQDDPDPRRFWVVGDTLMTGPSRDRLAPFRDADFILYQFAAAPGRKRHDVEALPFQRLWLAALDAASRATAGAWDEAKANLAAMASAITTSPDLTWDQGRALIRDRRAQLVAVHDDAKANAAAAEPSDPEARQLAAVEAEISDILRLP